MFYIATFIIRFICELNKDNKEQINCLVVDDTMIERSRGKKVELLSRQVNHVIGKTTVKVFTDLALGWTDGITHIPVLSYLIASSRENNLIRKADENNIDNRTTCAKRRKTACKKKTEILISMCRRTVRAISASYILMDSWFFSDYLVRKLKELGLQSICLVKSNPQFKLEKDSSKFFSQIKLLKHINGGRLNKSNLITSIIAYTNKNLRVRLVFVKARNSKDWICIVSTDLNLSPEIVIELYGRRWTIEVALAQRTHVRLMTLIPVMSLWFSQVSDCCSRSSTDVPITLLVLLENFSTVPALNLLLLPLLKLFRLCFLRLMTLPLLLKQKAVYVKVNLHKLKK